MHMIVPWLEVRITPPPSPFCLFSHHSFLFSCRILVVFTLRIYAIYQRNIAIACFVLFVVLFEVSMKLVSNTMHIMHDMFNSDLKYAITFSTRVELPPGTLFIFRMFIEINVVLRF